jgi:hypothetical protein
MKPGTLIRLPDGREGRVVYHHLDGYGIRWGRAPVDPGDLPEPDAMLRAPYPGARCECVGTDYEVISEAVQPQAGVA